MANKRVVRNVEARIVKALQDRCAAWPQRGGCQPPAFRPKRGCAGHLALAPCRPRTSRRLVLRGREHLAPLLIVCAFAAQAAFPATTCLPPCLLRTNSCATAGFRRGEMLNLALLFSH